MIIIGLLLLIVVVAFGVDLIANNSAHIPSPTAFGQSLGIHNEATLFVVGAVTGAAIVLAIVLILSGMRHKGTKAVRRRQERRDAKGTRGQRDDLVSDNEKLKSQLAKERASVQAAPTTTPTTTIVERPVEATDQSAKQPGATRAGDR